MKTSIKFLVVFLILIMPKFAFAQLAVFDAASFAKLVAQYNQMVAQAQILQQQATYLHQELTTLNSGQYQWSNAQSLINQLGGLVNQSNSLSYNAQNISGQFTAQFPGYQAPQNFNQQYSQNVNTTMNTLNGDLQSVGMSSQDFTNENSRLSFLQNQVTSAQGQTQAIQASAQISSEMVTQLQLLRQVLMTQTNAQTAYFAEQLQNQASSQAQFNQIINAGSTSVPAYGSSGNFVKVPSF